MCLTGQVDSVGPYYELMDLVVNATEAESFGIALLEAMAAGIPVVAVERGGPIDIVDPGVTGTLVASADPELIAEAVEALIADPDRRATMGEAGRSRCGELFSAERMATHFTSSLVGAAHG